MKTGDIFSKVAKQHGVTKEEVYTEIQKAIDVGFDNPDPAVQEEWKKMNISGKRPTPEEVIAYIVGQLQNKKDTNYAKGEKANEKNNLYDDCYVAVSRSTSLWKDGGF